MRGRVAPWRPAVCVCVNSKAEPSSYGDDLLAPQEKRHSGSFICPIKPKGWQSRFR